MWVSGTVYARAGCRPCGVGSRLEPRFPVCKGECENRVYHPEDPSQCPQKAYRKHFINAQSFLGSSSPAPGDSGGGGRLSSALAPWALFSPPREPTGPPVTQDGLSTGSRLRHPLQVSGRRRGEGLPAAWIPPGPGSQVYGPSVCAGKVPARGPRPRRQLTVYL